MSPIILIGAGILLLALGLGLGYWFARLQHQRETSNTQQELDDYRRNVTEHFGTTAQHFQELRQQYQSLYKHMAQGADALCDPAQTDALLGFAADSASATLPDNSDEPEVIEKVVRDYAPESEVEPVPAEAEATAAKEAEAVEIDTGETEASPVATDEEPVTEAVEELVAESVTEDVVADKDATAPVVEAARTVH